MLRRSNSEAESRLTLTERVAEVDYLWRVHPATATFVQLDRPSDGSAYTTNDSHIDRHCFADTAKKRMVYPAQLRYRPLERLSRSVHSRRLAIR